MLIVVSPAKSLDFDPIENKEYSKHIFMKETKKLVEVMRDKKPKDLKKLMSISDNLAELNATRYQEFSFPISKKNSKQSIFAFTGDVYRGFDVQQLNDKDLEYAQKHFRILSGLYGLLKPMDLMQPYRLEMGTKLEFDDYSDLYDYWGDKITRAINKDMKANGDKYLVNLASQEYFKSIQTNKLKSPIIDIHFKEYRDDKYKIISFTAKKARGMMSRFIIKNRIESIDDLKAFDEEDYMYNSDLSDELNICFTR